MRWYARDRREGDNVEYVTDERGKRTRVIPEIEEYERLTEAAIRNGEEERLPFERQSDRS